MRNDRSRRRRRNPSSRSRRCRSKGHSATAHASHLVSAKVQFLTEMLVVEVVMPEMTRPRNPALYDVPLLTFE
jgi:hypothetical protein